jgi:acyl-CoA thioester hydrolase
MTSVPYHHPIGIVPADIDHMGHVNNSVYLKWVQEAVVRYWESLAPPEAVARHLWVALSHEIKYRRPAFLTTMIMRGEEVIAEVRSSWCCLDSVSKRPARLAREIVAKFLPLA